METKTIGDDYCGYCWRNFKERYPGLTLKRIVAIFITSEGVNMSYIPYERASRDTSSGLIFAPAPI
ncbi:hypothetical protein J7J83_03895 [bacterium]|nr:hypothetical protein [bacterium]